MLQSLFLTGLLFFILTVVFIKMISARESGHDPKRVSDDTKGIVGIIGLASLALMFGSTFIAIWT